MIQSPISVTVVGGYLGAGKTTLVNHVLRSTPYRVAVLVNDFGELAIDEELIEADGPDMISLANGCICCSLVDGFATALESIQALDDPPPHLLVETSGVADPQSVAAYAMTPGFRLDAVIVLADAAALAGQLTDTYVGSTVGRQIAGADLVVLNKSDLVTADELADLITEVGRVAPDRPVVTVRDAAVPFQVVFGVFDRLDPGIGGPAPAADEHEHPFRSETWISPKPVSRDRLQSLLASLPRSLVRLKGIVRCDDTPDRREIIQLVGKRVEITPGGKWRDGDSSRLLAITVGAEGTGDLLRQRLGDGCPDVE